MTRRIALAALLGSANALDNGVGLLPPLGYNTWNDLSCSGMSEEAVLSAADALQSKGLMQKGYTYVNLDDCWQDPNGRDPTTGRLRADPKRFPSGMPKLAQRLHDKGFKFGIYTDRGKRTCAGREGSEGNEYLDAKTFADWGVDYVKEDNCFSSSGANDKDTLFEQFALFRDALNKTGRPIFFSVCGGGDQLPFANLSYYARDPRGGKSLANSWRVTSDVTGSLTFKFSLHVDAGLAEQAGPGGFNDPDMLLGSSPGAARRLSRKGSRTQFNMWAILMAPMLLGADVRQLSTFDLETYTNTEVLKVSQDPLAKQGGLLCSRGDAYVWGRQLVDGWAILFVSQAWLFRQSVVCSADCWEKLPFPRNSTVHVQDLWSEPLPSSEVRAGEEFALEVEAGDSRFLKLSMPSSHVDIIV
ncbi:unnamed protein product [Effrenium voratum]|uniref:Alpha-galactosidase n=1 Tax=Effrenium voratum TaxID=2562239 RepID=A0AA36NC69_9DINO|nr:unnamed protein product [Effrenium voratum]CAJ1444916.1 unnamed protein product [Effrenium voratum]